MVTGEFRVDNVVVTIQCAGTRTRHGDLILGGVVTDNTDGIAMVDEVNLAVGNPLALIIRNGASVTLYHPSLWYGEPASRHAGSCIDLVESVPDSLDGGFFEDVVGGVAIETAEQHGANPNRRSPTPIGACRQLLQRHRARANPALRSRGSADCPLPRSFCRVPIDQIGATGGCQRDRPPPERPRWCSAP